MVGTPWRELTFVELVTDSGERGLGEARLINKTDTLLACIQELGAVGMWSGRTRSTPSGWPGERMWEEYGRAGEITQTALGCFDQACYDLMGRRSGCRVATARRSFRDRIPAYANGWYTGERDAGVVRRPGDRGRRARIPGAEDGPVRRGPAELDYGQLAEAVGIVAAIREAVGPDIALMIEMHGRFTAATAVGAARALEPYRPEWIEEPVPPYHTAALRQVRAGTPLPIATGERVHVLAEFRELFERGTVDVVQADLTHFGGFTGTPQAGRRGPRRTAC